MPHWSVVLGVPAKDTRTHGVGDHVPGALLQLHRHTIQLPPASSDTGCGHSATSLGARIGVGGKRDSRNDTSDATRHLIDTLSEQVGDAWHFGLL